MGKRKRRSDDLDAPKLVTRSIKDSFSKCFRVERQQRIEEVVLRVSRIVRHAYEFAKVYLLSLDDELPIIDRNFFQCVFATIAPARDNRGRPPTPETAALRARMQEVHAESDIDNVGDTTSGISQALCFAADKMMNAYALNISSNFKSYLLRITEVAYTQPDAGHLLDRSSDYAYEQGIKEVVHQLMRGVRDDDSYAPLLLQHMDSLVPPGVNFGALHPRSEEPLYAWYWLEVPSAQPHFLKCAIEIMRLLESMEQRPHFNVLPLATSLIPTYVRFDTTAIVEMFTPRDLVELGLGVTLAEVQNNICFFADQIWELWVRSERRPFRRFDHSLETDGVGVSIQVALPVSETRPLKEPTEAYVGKRRDGDTRDVIGIHLCGRYRRQPLPIHSEAARLRERLHQKQPSVCTTEG